jgi:hypothetical protein
MGTRMIRKKMERTAKPFAARVYVESNQLAGTG